MSFSSDMFLSFNIILCYAKCLNELKHSCPGNISWWYLKLLNKKDFGKLGLVSVTLATWKVRQEDCKFSTNKSYSKSSRPAWATYWKSISNRKKRNQKEVVRGKVSNRVQSPPAVPPLKYEMKFMKNININVLSNTKLINFESINDFSSICHPTLDLKIALFFFLGEN